MADLDPAQADLRTRLAESRAEIRRLLDPAPAPADNAVATAAADAFPRSRTMRLLFSGRGVGTVGAALGGFVVARPALALRLLRLVPTGAVARLLLVEAVAALRAKRN